MDGAAGRVGRHVVGVADRRQVDDVPALGLLCLQLEQIARQIHLMPAGLDQDDRAAGLLTGRKDRVVPVLVTRPDRLARSLFGVLDRVVDNAEMEALARRRPAHARRPEPAARSGLPVLDRRRRLMQQSASAGVVFTCGPREAVGEFRAVARDGYPACPMTIQVVGREQAADQLGLTMARRLEHHDPVQLVVRHPLQDRDQLLTVAVGLIARVDQRDERAETERRFLSGQIRQVREQRVPERGAPGAGR